MNITETIESERRKWKNAENLNVKTVEDINNGYCKQFAKGVKDVAVDGVRIRTHDFDETYSSFAHAWIEFNGKHYDAECPEGVENPEELPFFKRNDIEPEISSI